MRQVYVGFIIDFILELAAVTEGGTILISSTSLYAGLCIYTKAMVDDLTFQMETIKENSLSTKQATKTLVNGIQFHCDIAG